MKNTSVSQSVARLFQILELFEKERRPLSSHEIIETLEIPRSSVAALLKNLVDLSILSVDRRTATYFPTAHFGRLGSWLTESFIQDPALLALVKDLQKTTAETVTLGRPIDHCMELFLVERSHHAISFIAEPGQKLSFWSSAVGLAYLSTLSNTAVRNLYDRFTRLGGDWAPQTELAPILKELDVVRDQGYIMGHGRVFPEATAFSISLPEGVGLQQLVLSIVGPNDRIASKKDQILSALFAATENM